MNIWAVGRNYGAHAKELGNDVPTTPLVFLKAGSTAVAEGPVDLASKLSQDIHHEVEIALRFGPHRDGHGHLFFEAAGLALDLTARDIQTRLKNAGQPWTLAKSFRESCPLSRFVSLPQQTPDFQFLLTVNGETRQSGDTRDMVFSFETMRRYVQENFPVEPGDVLLTGTPSGVARLQAGDRAKASFRSSLGHELVAEWVFR